MDLTILKLTSFLSDAVIPTKGVDRRDGIKSEKFLTTTSWLHHLDMPILQDKTR